MRMTTLARTGAALTASALALTLASGPATAADSRQDRAAVTSAPAATGKTYGPGQAIADGSARRTAAGAVVDVTKITASSGVLGYYDDDTDTAYVDDGVFPVKVYVSGDQSTISDISLRVKVDGKIKGYFPLFDLDGSAGDLTGLVLPTSVGTGKAQVVASRITYNDSTAPTDDTTRSNSFYSRRWVKAGNPALTIYYSGKYKQIKVRGIKVFSTSSKTYKAPSSIKFQYKSGSKWKTKKTIKLSSGGNGSYNFTKSTKYRYRIYYPRTSTIDGFATAQSSKL